MINEISNQLAQKYGRSCQARNIMRMIQVATIFEDLGIVTTLSLQLSWTHFIELFKLENKEAH